MRAARRINRGHRVSAELNALIRVVVAEHPHADLHELARHVAKMTPEESVMDFYTAALAGTIGEVIGGDRRNALDGPNHKNRSPKLERRRSWWADVLAARVHVGNANWLQIGDCGVDDLKFCIEERRTQIAGFQNQINNFEQLIALMVKHRARKVADLPAQTSWPK